MSLRIESEIGTLRSVLVHLPGREIDRMVPSMMQNLLFDDILFGARAREEHRRFQQMLRFVADEVLETSELLEEVLVDAERRDVVLASLAADLGWSEELRERLAGLGAGECVAALVEGIPCENPVISGSIDSLFHLAPLPNWCFQRDPAIVVGDKVIRASMATPARLREPLLSGAVFAHHPRFARPDGPFWFQEFSASWGPPVSWARMRPTLEGGDVLVLRQDLLAIGYSERTEKVTIERLAEALKRERSEVRRIVVVGIPPARSYMHLDTVFTMISAAECLCYGPMILPGGAEEADVYEADLTKREISWTAADDLLSALRARQLDLEPIACGGDDPIDQQREQWTDGANAFALAPGVILCYERNERTADALAARGYEVVRDDDLLLGRTTLDLRRPRKYALQLSATELARARGGPRCMTMPLVRDAA
ncbi:MAG TPA: arginine deiminase family protein [Thermoanaerobaculia bacterium]|nr:arginine deiminase family protein [Thermoanaerobaculia bacterium]